MATAFRLSAESGLCPPEDAERAIAHLEAVGLPTTTDADPDRLAERMRHDKKGGSRVLTRGIGKAFVGTMDSSSQAD
jgi:3-dehydroquinate synthase